MKILVIDDAPVIVEVVAICLQLRWGHAQVLPASNGTRGLEIFAAEKPDLVVLDVNLPDMDGFQVLEKIRETSAVPVVMLTVKGKDMDTDIARGLEMGADDYVIKPFNNIELIARLENAMRHGQTKAEE